LIYSGLKNSPHPRYSPEISNTDDKENDGNYSNVIQPYSPPQFHSEKRRDELKPPIFGQYEPDRVQRELIPIEHPISPDQNSSNGYNPNMYPSVMDLGSGSDKKEDEIKSMWMFNNSIDSAPASSPKIETIEQKGSTPHICKLFNVLFL